MKKLVLALVPLLTTGGLGSSLFADERELNELRVHFLNVGAGTCTLVECPGTDSPPPMIVDCGSIGRTSSDMTPEEAHRYITNILDDHESAPNVVLSHADKDHYGWIPTVLKDVQADNIWQGGKSSGYTKHGFPRWIKEQEDNGATRHRDLPRDFHNEDDPMGPELDCGDAEVFILTVNTGSSTNSLSLVLAIEYGDFAVTLTGDAEGRTERQSRKNFDEAVKTTVLSGSHHGAKTHSSNSVGWAEATDPEVVIFSAGRKFGHPQCRAVNRYKDSVESAPRHPTQCGDGSRYKPVRNSRKAIYMTEINGRIVVTSDGNSPLSLSCNGSRGCSAEIEHD